MRKIITQLVTAIIAFLFSLSVSAQTITYSGSFPITMQGYTQICTDPVTAGWAGTTSAATSSARNGKCFTTATDGNFNSGKNITYRVPSCGTMTLQANGTVGRGFIVTVTKVSDGSQLSRTVWAYSNATCSSQDFVINSPNPVNITILSPSAVESGISSTGSSYISYINITGMPKPSISAFTAEGITATINEDAKTITAVLPYGSSLTSITPVVTLGGTATTYSPTGAQDFSGGAVTYTASDATTSVNYAVTLTVPATVPAPAIALTSGSAIQTLKAGGNLVDIVYNLTNATGASVQNLPTGLSGNFVSTGTNAGNYTISGTVQSGVAPGAFDFTVTATAITGYSGSDITTTGSVKVKSSTANDVLYLIGGSSLPTTDLLYPYLDTNPNLLFTLKTAASTAPASTIYDDYELIIVHESVAGGNAELNALKLINKPILNFKSFEYNSGRWVWGTADNGLSTNLSITVKQPSHPIFNGISEAVLNASLDLISAVSGSKGIQPADITLPGSINVATAPKAAGTAAVAIHDVPGAVRGTGITAKYLLMPIFADSYQNLTATAKTMISNAVEYLLNGTQFAAPSLQISSLTAEGVSGTIDHTAGTIEVKVPIGTDRTAITPVITLEGVGTSVSPLTAQNFVASAVNYTVSDMINAKVYAVSVNENGTSTRSLTEDLVFDGKTVFNPSHAQIQMFDTAGRRMLSSTNDINLSAFKNGIYIFRMQNRILKVTLIK